jgi:hypothetical protein
LGAEPGVNILTVLGEDVRLQAL